VVVVVVREGVVGGKREGGGGRKLSWMGWARRVGRVKGVVDRGVEGEGTGAVVVGG